MAPNNIIKNEYDVIIIGGGIAGMTAAIYISRANLKVAIIEKEICGGLANWTHTIENYPGFNSINGMELMEKIKQQVILHDVDVYEVTEIKDFDFSTRDKSVIVDEFNLQAKSVILSIGRKPIALSIDTEDFAEHIHYCSICDGNYYKNKSVLVVGGGNSAFDESLYLAALGVENIQIIDAMDHCIADQSIQQRALNSRVISVLNGHTITEIIEEKGCGIVTIKNLQTQKTLHQKADGIFVFIGQQPNTKEFQGVINLDKKGYIIVDQSMRTNVQGIYAAGDVIVKKYRQLTTAASDGTIAALEAIDYISGDFLA